MHNDRFVVATEPPRGADAIATLIDGEVRRYCGGTLSERSIDEIVAECAAGAGAGADHRQVRELVTLALRARVDRHPSYASIAARLVCASLYEEILGVDEFHDEFHSRYRSTFAEQLERGVAQGLFDRRLLAFDMNGIAAALVPERDRLLKYMGAQMLHDRFLAKGAGEVRLETPQYFWMRIAMGLALPEDGPRRDDAAIRFYDAISTLRAMPCTSPTLYHAGTACPQTGCYVLSVRDNLDSIYDTISTDAQIASLSAGFGNDWTAVRGTGAIDGLGQISSQGPVSFLKVLDATVAAFNRSGRRHSAACAYLETWHYDIEDFLQLRRTVGDERRRLSDISTANWIPDLFMKRVLSGGHWTLFSPDEAPDLHTAYGRDFERRYEEYERRAERGGMRLWKRLDARTLWRQMVTRLYETGHPWMTFKDPCNIRSSQDQVGAVGSANLCTEIIVNASPDGVGVTTLGSVNLAAHVENRVIDWEGLAESIRTGVRMLDNALQVSQYPTPAIGRYALEHRPIGLGVMGFQDALHQVGLDFDSEEACGLSDELMEFVSFHAIMASTDLARERGQYASFTGSKWDRGQFPIDTLDLLEAERGMPVEVDRDARLDWTVARAAVAEHGMRNCNVVAVAPTQTLANLAGCFPSIEPAYKQVYVKSNSSGDFAVLNEHLVADLEARGLWSDEMATAIKRHDGSVQRVPGIPEDLERRYRGAFEIDPMWVVRHAAKRGKWIDQGQSINIFTDSDSGRLISDLYQAVWRMGIKTTYYLKTLGASAIESSTAADELADHGVLAGSTGPVEGPAR
jgi:ribonucleoside-diphosphate reductase alpha chain